MTNGAVDQAVEATQDAAEAVLNQAETAEGKVLDTVDSVQETLGQATPVSTNFDVVASPNDVKSRLDWGEPALTILDVRDREAFNRERIMGAMAMPMANLSEKAGQALSLERDIYVYGDSDNDSSAAAMKLSDLGFKKVSVLRGGLPAWKAIDGPVEGQIQGPGALD